MLTKALIGPALVAPPTAFAPDMPHSQTGLQTTPEPYANSSSEKETRSPQR